MQCKGFLFVFSVCLKTDSSVLALNVLLPWLKNMQQVPNPTRIMHKRYMDFGRFWMMYSNKESAVGCAPKILAPRVNIVHYGPLNSTSYFVRISY